MNLAWESMKLACASLLGVRTPTYMLPVRKLK